MQNIADLIRALLLLQLVSVGSPLVNIFTLNGVDILTKSFPSWSSWFRTCLRRRQSIDPPTKSPSASVTCERGIPNQANNRQQTNQNTIFTNRMDAVVHHITTLPAMKSLLSVTHHDYLPNEYDPVMIENDIYFELLDMKVSDGQPEIIKFRLTSYEHDVQFLQTFIETCNTRYELLMANKLGAHRYYFDQMIQSKARGNTQNPLPTTHLVYTKSKFTTNRTFDNVFFEERDHVRDRTKFFLEHRDWYDKKGIPYTLGFMFHGPPGTGKTSSVKAIANVGRRHIINVQLSEIKSKQQLQHLFFNDEIHVHNGTNTERYIIPVSERLYVIEDIDAMGDTVLRREWKKPETTIVKKETGDTFFDRPIQEEKEKIDLSFLLNLLDGTLEANGRILIITTNFPERIDKALIRPGRVDLIVHFKKCSLGVLREMANSFYEKEVSIPEDPSLEYKWSPAEVNQILFRNFGNADAAVEELVSMKSEDLYGFQENGNIQTLEEVLSESK